MDTSYIGYQGKRVEKEKEMTEPINFRETEPKRKFSSYKAKLVQGKPRKRNLYNIQIKRIKGLFR